MKFVYLLGIVCAIDPARARTDISPWTGQRTPAIFTEFGYDYAVAAEVEIPRRSLHLIVEDLDLTGIEPLWSTMFFDYTDGYLDAQTLGVLAIQHPEVAARLTEGLDLTRDFGTMSARALRAHRTEFARTLGEKHSLILPPPARWISERRPIISAPPKLGDAREDGVAESSLGRQWALLGERWRRIDPWTRRSLVDVSRLSPRWKAEALLTVLRRREHENSPRYDLEYTSPRAAEYLRPFVLKLENHSVVEIQHRDPESSAVNYLRRVFDLARALNVADVLKNPHAYRRRDSSYHLTFSVDGRRESLRPILRAWQHLIVAKHLAAGVTNIFGSESTDFNGYLESKGMVRLHHDHMIELRDHFTNPEIELAMFMMAAQRSNDEAMRLIYDHFMPSITPAVVRFIHRHSPDAFREMFFETDRMRAEFPEDVVSSAPTSEAIELLHGALVHDGFIDHPQRYSSYLGPEGMEAFRRAFERLAEWELAGVPPARIEAIGKALGELEFCETNILRVRKTAPRERPEASSTARARPRSAGS